MYGDFKQDDANHTFETSRRKTISRAAAIFVVAGESREKALAAAAEIFEARQHALDDVTGTADLLDDAQSPKMPTGQADVLQVRAIALELFEAMNKDRT